MNHLRLTSTYTSYFLLLLFVTKYYKLAVYASGVKSDQTFILMLFTNEAVRIELKEESNKDTYFELMHLDNFFPSISFFFLHYFTIKFD
jgi:hypothetical protein